MAEEWSVVAVRARERNPHRSDRKEVSNGDEDESLIGSFVYRPDRARHTPSDSHLIGAPFVISETGHAQERRDEDGAQGQRGGGLLKLTPAMLQEIEKDSSTQPDFSFSSFNDWPAFTPSHFHTSTDHTSTDHAPTSDTAGKSWSTVLKTPAPPPPPKLVREDGSHSDAISDSDSEVEAPKKKKKKKKKKKEQDGLIKDKQPLTLELGALFENLQVKPTKGKKVVFSTGGGLAVTKAPPTQHVHPSRAELPGSKGVPRGGNILDSTAPQIRRGKEREQPKKRKPTPLRKIINKEKEERKKKTVGEATKNESNDEEATKNESNDGGEATKNESNDEEATKNESDTCVDEAVTLEAIKNDLSVYQSPPLVFLEEPNDESDEGEVNDESELSIKERTTEALLGPHPPIKTKPHPLITTNHPKISMHNRRFREYCTHIVTEEINECAQNLLSELLRFQDRQFLKDPLKAKVKKRYVCGMREVLKHLKSRRIKCLIVAPNMDRIQAKGGTDDVIGQILSLAEEKGIPLIFAMSRRRLALTLKKTHKVACVGVFRYEGAESHYKRLLELVEEATEQYKSRSTDLQATITEPSPPLAVPGSKEEADSSTRNGNGTCALISDPWAVFFNQQPVQAGKSPSGGYSPNSGNDKGLVHQPHPPHVTSHVINATGQFNVFAKEFVPTSLNVNAPEFCPKV